MLTLYNFHIIFQKFKILLQLLKDYLAARIFLTNNPNFQQQTLKYHENK